MSHRSIILVGNPDSGKTNYITFLWKALQARTFTLVAPTMPTGIAYVEDALQHIHSAVFAPRSDKGMLELNQNLRVSVVRADAEDEEPIEIVVPDVVGELWKSAVESYDIPAEWMDQLREASGALLFVRVQSEENVAPLDWVNSAAFLRWKAKQRQEALAAERGEGEIAPDAATPPAPNSNGEDTNEEEDIGEEPPEGPRIPTQVSLCELLRFLEEELGTAGEHQPRVAVLITAWDRLDAATRAKGPVKFLESQFPLFAGRLKDVSVLECKAYGVSAAGGDFSDPEFVERFRKARGRGCGFVVEDTEDGVRVHNDITLPIAWVIDEGSA